MTNTQNSTDLGNTSAAAKPPSDGSSVAPTQLPDIAKMRAELERLMGKPDAPDTEKQQSTKPQK